LVGAPSDGAAGLMANALASLGLKRAFVVRGSDGLDEITTTGPTLVFEVDGGHVQRRVFRPEDFGVPAARPEDLKGGDKNRNLEIARAILSGEKGPKRDIVIVNASAALVAAGKASNLGEGVKLAIESLDSGAAVIKARQLAEFCRSNTRARA
ncbi:MAG: anthranilate phosphoribosyltransferase, partial [Bryobacteraceae bacterium]